MRKRLAVLAAAAGVLALSVSLIAPAASDQRYDRVNFTVREKVSDDDQTNIEIDVGKKGFGVGDYSVVSKDPFFNRSLEKELGYFTGDCLVVALDEEAFEATLECDVTANFRDGSILTIEGPITFSEEVAEPEATLAVTGGTGKYKAAHGEVHITFAEEGGTFRFKLLL